MSSHEREATSASDSPDELTEELVADCLSDYLREGEPALERACKEHPEQADLIRAWIGSLEQMGLLAPLEFGAYRIVRVLGEGGMGMVYLAEQREPVRRRVALKVIKLGMDTKQVLRRFEAERQALALMGHDNIARVFDAGATERGQPYFVMEHVPGVPITEHCDKYRLGTRDRLRLFQSVCAGVQHAHQKGVIHRDLKPANILTTVEQGRAVPKIIDFGLARATDHRALAASLYTEQGQAIGTPEYMSPEQAEMSSEDVDTRTDIYSLGVILYELLVGELPIASRELRGSAPQESRRRRLEEGTPKPSSRLSSRDERAREKARARGTTVESLRRTLRGDLDWIVMKALENDRNRRYPTASELAADVQRYLEREPVEAGPPSALYRLRKFAVRHRTQVAAAGLVLVALVGGLLASLSFSVEASEARRRAETVLGEFDLLANGPRLERARALEARLYPAWPETAPALQRWLLEQGEPLARALPRVQLAVQELERRVAQPGGPTAREGFLLDTLSSLSGELEAFNAPDGELARARERLAWAEAVHQRSIGDHEPEWAEAILALRSSSLPYDGLELEPQLGLVPLGPDPDSGLWEFYHLRSGDLPAPPRRDPRTGRLPELDAEWGLVFVLLPGGITLMGAQNHSPDQFHYDPHAMPPEGPVHELELDPFFLSKYELTIAQWRRMSLGEMPSYYQPGGTPAGATLGQRVRWTNPVESVSWIAAERLLSRHGLRLPTEAQWEYATRAGTMSPWWTGDDPAELEGAVNIGDRSAIAAGFPWPELEDWLEDGFAVHAPVDTLRPNPFGLHHTLGNVWEWCLDQNGPYSSAWRAGDGLRISRDETRRILRGGSYYDVAFMARASGRGFERPDHSGNSLGVRPARALVAGH